MKKLQSISVIIFCAIALFFASCKKSSSTDITISDVSHAQIHSEDEAVVDGETDNVDNDIDNTVASSIKLCGIGNVYGNSVNHLPPDADTNNPANSATKIILTFNGTVGCRKRTGTITIELLNKPKWVEPGAVLKYTFTNFKVEDICRSRSITINGERFVTNVNGGNLVRLRLGQVTGNALLHRIKNGASGLVVDFTDSSGTKTANWNAARKRTMTFDADVFYLTIDGDTTRNGVPNTVSWGTTRLGKSYQTSITNSISANTHCGLWKPTSGTVLHTVGTFPVTVQYGLDLHGNPSAGCPNFYQVSWTLNGTIASKIFQYR